MSTHRTFDPRTRHARRSVGVAVAIALCGLPGSSTPRAGEPPASHAAMPMHHHDRPMTDADMRKWVEDWYAVHPRTGDNVAGGPAAVFRVLDFAFDADGNPGDIDTVRIHVGDIVQWTWVSGFHTTTNGLNSIDPNAGHLWDQSIVSTTPQFSFQFNTPGLVPFFCRPHENLMFGFIRVLGPTDVVPIGGRGDVLGFTEAPAPNPTIDSTTFRFAVGASGRVQVEVFDVSGRRVATAVDRQLGPGAYAASWDGRTDRGEQAAAGVYYLRLTGPGVHDSREVVVAR